MEIASTITRVINWARSEVCHPGLELLFPDHEPPGARPKKITAPFCSRCGNPFDGKMDAPFICYNCTQRKWHMDAARAPYRMEGKVREAIHGFKYEGRYYWIRPLTCWLEEGFQNLDVTHSWDGLVPVPLHHRRQRERGFNQAESLADSLAKRIGIPVINCLKRTSETPHQALLTRALRLRNLRKSIETREEFDVRGKHLLIIDDVFTTGATVDACAKVLKKSGATTVVALTIARG